MNDAEIEEKLREAVEEKFSAGDLDNLTIKKVRQTVESLLQLDEGFFKSDEWREKSKAIIQAAVEASENAASSAQKKTSSKRKSLDNSKPSVKRRRTSDAQDAAGEAIVLDEVPKSKKRSGPKSGSSRTGKAPSSAGDPEAEEIKQLQGWLIKCGIRKMWHRELSSCETAKAKICHLKQMLADAGMPGRYSKERAEQIREERELRADLEAVQEGDRAWGKPKADQDDSGRPRRQMAKGLQELAFFDNDDSE